MANEITITYSGQVKNGNFLDSLPSETLKINQNAVGGTMDVQTVTTTAAAVPLNSVSANGICYAKNLDPTNYVEIGVYISSTFYPLIRLAANGVGNVSGEVAIFRVSPSATLYWKANTASCQVQLRLYQN